MAITGYQAIEGAKGTHQGPAKLQIGSNLHLQWSWKALESPPLSGCSFKAKRLKQLKQLVPTVPTIFWKLSGNVFPMLGFRFATSVDHCVDLAFSLRIPACRHVESPRVKLRASRPEDHKAEGAWPPCSDTYQIEGTYCKSEWLMAWTLSLYVSIIQSKYINQLATTSTN